MTTTAVSLKVLHLVSGNLPHVLLQDVAQRLGQMGVSVVLGSLDAHGALQDAAERLGLDSIALDCKTPRDYPLAVLRLVEVLRAKRIDVVHTHLTHATIVGLVAARIAGVPGRV